MTFNGYNDYLTQERLVRMGLKPYQRSNISQDYRVMSSATPIANSPTQAASTFIRRITYLPSARSEYGNNRSGTVFVRIGNSEYNYPMTQRQLAMWLTNKSLGQYYNNYVKLK